jgi:hypothetical protein
MDFLSIKSPTKVGLFTLKKSNIKNRKNKTSTLQQQAPRAIKPEALLNFLNPSTLPFGKLKDLVGW